VSKSKIAGKGLDLEGLAPDEIKQLSDANDAIIAARTPGSALASLPLPGPLRNPGFETVPWRARPETTTTGLGQFCPSHLHIFSEIEMDEAHYPNAQRDDFGKCDKFCWACGRPVASSGLSGKGHRGTGKPCPACGFRRKRVMNERTMSGLRKGTALLKQAQAEGYTGTAAWARVKEIAPREGIAEVKREERLLKAGRDSVPTLTELMRMKAHERAERILKPYWESLDLDPKDDWSPSTKLEFYNGQTAIAEKLLNRLEGLPVARHRHVDKDDEDVIPEGELSPRVVAKLVGAILAGVGPEELVVEDAEFEEVDSTPEAAPSATDGASGVE